MKEEVVDIAAGSIQLQGNLLIPEGSGPFPAILYLSGSGPIDRDDNIQGQTLNNSKLISWHLAESGIASLRTDKRGVGASEGDYDSAGHSDFLFDAERCIDFLKQHDSIDNDNIYIIGHSMGSIMAPQLSASCAGIAGIVLLCPYCGDSEQLLIQQAQDLQKMIDAKPGFSGFFLRLTTKIFNQVRMQRRMISKVKRSEKDVIRFALQKLPAKFFREMLALDTVAIFKQVPVPTLVIGGEKDFQCYPEDVAKIEKLIPAAVESHVIENMSHLLRYEPGPPSIFTYKDQLKQDLLPEIPRIIEAWLTRQIASH